MLVSVVYRLTRRFWKKTVRSTKPEVSAIFREDSDAMSTVGDKI